MQKRTETMMKEEGSPNSKIDVSTLTNVPETMLVPLYFKAKETKENGIIKDDKAVEILSRIDYDFSRMQKDWKTQTGMAVRTFLFDKIVHDLHEKIGPEMVIVNIGAGLDTRQERFPGIKWYQLDLPESIAIRKQFFPPADNINLVAKSLLDFTWIDDIAEREHVLFMAEGVFMYFTEVEVKSVFQQIGQHFRHSFITFNTIHESMMGHKHTSVDTTKAPLQWGIKTLEEIFAWKAGWKPNLEFFPPDYFRHRWGWMQLLKYMPTAKTGFVIAVLETEA